MLASDGGSAEGVHALSTDLRSVCIQRGGLIRAMRLGGNAPLGLRAARQDQKTRPLATPPLWHADAVRGVHTCTVCKCLVGTRCKLARRASSLGATSVHSV